MTHAVEKLRNIAIIAHVDHGKTTLVDHMFKQSGVHGEHQETQDRVMDSMDLERERGITIAAKNCSVRYKDFKINILDTPGHADFGGEVERALSMVDGAILLVDASEGPLPQTRFVLQKALQSNLKLAVVINKIDRSDARPSEVLDEIYELFFDLDAREDQIEFPVLYAVGRDGVAAHALDGELKNLVPLFETIVETVPSPRCDARADACLLVSDLSYSDYLGHLAIGRIAAGTLQKGVPLVCIGESGKPRPFKTNHLQTYEGLSLAPSDEVGAGDIVVLACDSDVHIGDTICARENPKPLPRINIDEPTVTMRFAVNSSPFSGRDGKYVQSTKLRERLIKETLRNVALKVEDGEDGDSFMVSGRGEFQMAILIETMRREGFELSVGRPTVIYREENGKRLEPIERLFIDCEEEHVGVISEKLSHRKGRMTNMVNHGSGRVRVEFSIPSRGLIGYRGEFMTDTRGTGMMNAYLEGYEPYRGDFPTRLTGSLVSDRKGEALAYALYNLEPRGELLIVPGAQVYEGMIVGLHNRDNDLNVNPCKAKKLTNMRASGKDEGLVLTPVTPLSLERAIDLISDDETVEVTPKVIRLRKRILSIQEREIEAKQAKSRNASAKG